VINYKNPALAQRSQTPISAKEIGVVDQVNIIDHRSL